MHVEGFRRYPKAWNPKAKPVPKMKHNHAFDAAQKLLRAIPEHVAKWQNLHREFAAYALKIEPHPGVFLPNAEAELSMLGSAIQRALPYIDFPPRSPSYLPWQAAAFSIAVMAEDLWRSAGKKQFSLECDSPLIDVVVSALDRIAPPAPPHATVASALRRVPAMQSRRQHRK